MITTFITPPLLKMALKKVAISETISETPGEPTAE
jgi:hypothetical protein